MNDLNNNEEYSAVELVRSPRLGRTMAYWSGGIFLLLVLFSFLPWTQNIHSDGYVTTLLPKERPQTIQSTIAGRIERWYVQEGEYVEKGDTIVSLSEVKDKFFDPDMLLRISEQIHAKEEAMHSIENKSKALSGQIKALHDGMHYSLEKARNKLRQMQLKVEADSIEYFSAAITDNKIAQRQLEGIEQLYKKGLKSLTEYENARAKYQQSVAKLQATENRFFSSRNEMLNAKIELNSIEAEYLDKIFKTESELNSTMSYLHETEAEISKMNNEYANMQIRSSYYFITAPQDGYIVKALKMGVGENIKEGEAVTSVMPVYVHKAVELYVKPMDLPLLERGSMVRLQFDGWPALVFTGWPGSGFGTFGGKVAVIDNVDTKGMYRVLVVPDPDDEPWPDQIRVGSGVYGWMLLNDVPIWYEIWRQLNGFPPDFTRSGSNDAIINSQNEMHEKQKEKVPTY